MKKSNTTKKLYDRKEGHYATIHNTVLQNDKLSPNAKILLIHLLNNSGEWQDFLWHYSKLYGWNRNKQAAITKELKTNGFLKVEKKSNGKGKPFTYNFHISELGDIGQEAVTEAKSAIQTPPATKETAKDVQPPVEVVKPTRDDLSFLDGVINYMNTKGSDHAKQTIKAKVTKEVLKRFRRFESDADFARKIDDVFTAIATPILASDRNQA